MPVVVCRPPLFKQGDRGQHFMLAKLHIVNWISKKTGSFLLHAIRCSPVASLVEALIVVKYFAASGNFTTFDVDWSGQGMAMLILKTKKYNYNYYHHL